MPFSLVSDSIDPLWGIQIIISSCTFFDATKLALDLAQMERDNSSELQFYSGPAYRGWQYRDHILFLFFPQWTLLT